MASKIEWIDVPPPMIPRMSSIQSGPTISSASSMIVYLPSSAFHVMRVTSMARLLDTAQGQQALTLHEVLQTTRGSDQNIAALA